MSLTRLFADISNNNSHYVAAEYKAAGHIFIALKATEGEGFVDGKHRMWAMHSHWSGIGVAHYHFARPDTGSAPDAEARRFLEVALPLAGPHDYLVCDLERATPAGWSHDPAWSRGFDGYVQSHSRFHTVLYANRSTLEQSDAFLAGDNRRVWDADWSRVPDYAPHRYTVLFRQYTDGVVGPGPHDFAGIGRCDGNAMSPDVFKRLSQHHTC